MEIVDISDDYVSTYCNCLEDWSDEIREAGPLKKAWYERKRKQGLRVKLAKNDNGDIVGMIHYIPIENSPVAGHNLYYIYCIWVHGHKKGVGDNRKKGIGKLLLAAAEDDVRRIGSAGIVAWGITLPFFMRSIWFKKQGYSPVDKDGMIELVWKPFTSAAEEPRLLRLRKKPAPRGEKARVTCFRNGWCTAQNLSCERMKRAAEESGDRVDLVEIDTDDRGILEEWGISDGIFVNDRQIPTGPPPSFKKLRNIIKKEAGKIADTGRR